MGFCLRPPAPPFFFVKIEKLVQASFRSILKTETLNSDEVENRPISISRARRLVKSKLGEQSQDY